MITPDGTTRLDDVRDKHYYNTDHVPMWYTSVGNYSLGKKPEGRAHERTGRKGNDRFTTQLIIGKGGKKYTTFLIFKGDFLSLCILIRLLT